MGTAKVVDVAHAHAAEAAVARREHGGVLLYSCRVPTSGVTDRFRVLADARIIRISAGPLWTQRCALTITTNVL